MDSNLFFGHGVDNAFDEAVWLIMSGAEIKEEALNQKLNLNEKQMLAIDVLANMGDVQDPLTVLGLRA